MSMSDDCFPAIVSKLIKLVLFADSHTSYGVVMLMVSNTLHIR